MVQNDLFARTKQSIMWIPQNKGFIYTIIVLLINIYQSEWRLGTGNNELYQEEHLTPIKM